VGDEKSLQSHDNLLLWFVNPDEQIGIT